MLKYFFLMIVLVFVAGFVLALRPNVVFGVNGYQLAHSVNQQVRAAAMDCGEKSADATVWTCWAEADPGSGYVSLYKVRLDDANCWTARRTSGSEYARRASGCVEGSDPFWDIWWWF